MARCEHIKRKDRCAECKAVGVGGTGLCPHNRQQCICKECKASGVGGTSLCPHDRMKSDCKECKACKALGIGGTGICFHGHQKSVCKECKTLGTGGTGVCEHRRRKDNCSRCSPQTVYKAYKYRAKSRGLSFELTFEEFKWLVDSSCSMCGEDFMPMGIDRIDSDYGYRFDNTQPMCAVCNEMKSDRSEEEFDNHIIKIIKHRPNLGKERHGEEMRASTD